MKRELPARPNVEHIKTQAKDLLDAQRAGDESAKQRFAESLPHAHEPFALHDAQSVVAREYGFESFAKLCMHVETLAMRTLMAGHPNAPLPEAILEKLHRLSSAKPDKPAPLTSACSLPMIALRGALVTVGSLVPIHVGRAASIAAANAARANGGSLAVFSQKDAAIEAPSEGDLHRIGCVVQLLDTQSEAAAAYLVLRGTQWVTLEALERTDPYPIARVAPFTITTGDEREVARLEPILRNKVEAVVATMPGAARIRAMFAPMTPGELADATIANLPCSLDDKARYASEATVAGRLARALALLG